MKVPQFETWLGDEVADAVRGCIDRNWITEGPNAAAFLDEAVCLVGSRYGVLVPNGTLGLYLALRAVGIGPGDEVLVPDFTFVATATAVEMAGAKPVFVDVEPRGLQIDVEQARKRVGPRTRAILPVHVFGAAADMEAVLSLARERSLIVIEDAAQGIGVRPGGRHVGTFGQAGVFSFSVDKTITMGEGGLIVTDDEALYRKLQSLRNHGRQARGSFIHPEIGYNFRVTDLQCAMGLVQLRRLEEIIRRKRRILERYRERLASLPSVRLLSSLRDLTTCVPFRAACLAADAQGLMAHLRSLDIETRTFFGPLHAQPCFRHLNEKPSLFPVSSNAYQSGVCLPTFPTLKEEQLEYVCRAIRQYYEQHRERLSSIL